MGITDDLFSSLKNTLKGRAESAVIGGVDKGIRSAISKIKNRCPKCGKPVEDTTAKFCPNCRANLVLTCPNPNCQKTLALGTKFCPACGTELEPKKK